MAKVTPSEFQEKHARRLKGSLEDIKRGVLRVESSPTEAAAAAVDKWAARVSEEKTRLKFQRNLRKVSKEDWQKAMIDKGVGRIAAGIDAAKDKVTDFASRFLPHLDQLKDKLKGMPSLTLDNNIERMIVAARHNATFSNE